MRALTTGTICLTLTMACLACNRDRSRASADSEGSQLRPASRTVSSEDALVEARCAREDRCENVGNDKRFMTLEDCVQRVKADWKMDLEARACSRGIEEKQLHRCVTEMGGSDCDELSTALGRIEACSVGEICR